MIIQELGKAIRAARTGKGLTQAELATLAGLSRNTLNRLENGLFPDLGVKKAETLLHRLGLELRVRPANRRQTADFVSMAAASASVSFKKTLSPDELVHGLLSGKVPAGKKAHFIALLDEAPQVLMEGLVKQVGPYAKPGKVEKNLQKIAKQVGLAAKAEVWKKTD